MDNRFIGRVQELKALEKLYAKEGFQMSIVYGRRRVGKTTLLKKFTEGKKTVYFTAVKTTIYRNLELFSRRVLEALAPDIDFTAFPSYDELFSVLTKQSKTERLVVVIDEFPYMAGEDKSLTSLLQKYIDTEWIDGNMFLILSGSSISFMENQVLSEKSPLFGRRTSQLKLNPFSYLESAEFLPNLSREEKALLHGITGGVAKYLSLFDAEKTLDENIVDLFFSRTGYLYEETTNLLTQEFRNVPVYSAVVEAIAFGANKVSEIVGRTHIDAPSVSHALNNLLSTGIVRKESAITEEKNKKKTQYRLLDSMFRFWYRYIPSAVDVIEIGGGEAYYYQVVKPELTDYMGEVFEEMCRDYTMRESVKGRLGCFITSIGRWWGTDPICRKEAEIDIVGISKPQKKAVIGECKFRNKKVGVSVLTKLKERGRLLDRQYEITQYFIFAKAGFTENLKKTADLSNVRLIDIKDLYKEI